MFLTLFDAGLQRSTAVYDTLSARSCFLFLVLSQRYFLLLCFGDSLPTDCSGLSPRGQLAIVWRFRDPRSPKV